MKTIEPKKVEAWRCEGCGKIIQEGGCGDFEVKLNPDQNHTVRVKAEIVKDGAVSPAICEGCSRLAAMILGSTYEGRVDERVTFTG